MMRPKIPRLGKRQRGVSIIAAVFFLVLFAAIAAAMVSLTTTSNATSALDVQGSRAYQAARAGLEWGIYQVLDPNNTTATSATAALPACPGAAFPGVTGFTVTVVCTPYPAVAAVPSYYEEGSRRLRIFEVSATATAAAPGSGISRQLTAVVEKCRDTASTSAPYDC